MHGELSTEPSRIRAKRRDEDDRTLGTHGRRVRPACVGSTGPSGITCPTGRRFPVENRTPLRTVYANGEDNMSGHDDTTNDAFDQAVLSHIGLIRHIGASRLRRREIEDFTQSVLLKIYANRHQLRMHGLKSWIGTVARNTATAWNRKREPIFTDALPDIPFPVPPVDEMLEGQERWQSLVECLRRLSTEDEALLRAFYIEERSYEELQGQLSLPYRALSVRLSRARKRLREHASTLLACLGFATPPPGERALGETTLGGNRMAMTTSAALSAFLVAFAGISSQPEVLAEYACCAKSVSS